MVLALAPVPLAKGSRLLPCRAEREAVPRCEISIHGRNRLYRRPAPVAPACACPRPRRRGVTRAPFAGRAALPVVERPEEGVGVLVPQPALLTTDRREAAQTAVDPGWPASPSPQAGLRPVEDSDEETARRCGRLRGRSRCVVRGAGEKVGGLVELQRRVLQIVAGHLAACLL